MTDDWVKDKDSAIEVFVNIVWPAWIKDGVMDSIIVIEDKDEEIAQLLDKEAGIDALLDTGKGKFPVALRTQQDAYNWRTFTIRKDRDTGAYTEYEKLCYAIDNDSLRPHFIIQSYLDHDRLLGSAIGDIKEVIQYIRDNPKCPTNNTNNAVFYYVSWDVISCRELVIKDMSQSEPVEEYTPLEDFI